MPARGSNGSKVVWLGALSGVGLGLAVASRPRLSRALGRRDDERQDALRRYLIDHLTGSDSAFLLVDRLRHAHRDTPHAALFDSLHREFAEERQEVMALLHRLGATPISLKRVLGKTAGVLSQAAGAANPGTLSFFATLEALAIGVQGKRCLWRAAQQLEPALAAVGPRSFAELEDLAISQWQRIERRRLALVAATFEARPIQALRRAGGSR